MSRAEYNRRYYEKNRDAIREQKKLNMRRYREMKPEHHRKINRDAQSRLKALVFEMYGNVCCRCGFDDIRALTLDHILNNGADERRELGERGVYRRAVEVHRPDEYRILCMNCQFISRSEASRHNQHKPAVVRAAWELLT